MRLNLRPSKLTLENCKTSKSYTTLVFVFQLLSEDEAEPEAVKVELNNFFDVMDGKSRVLRRPSLSGSNLQKSLRLF